MTTKNTTQDSISADFIRDRAAQFNSQTGWDINAAEALAIEVLTDCNAHAEVRLYKAAPELLEALREALRVLVTPSGFPDKGKGRTDEQQAAYDKACAAIAKATGETEGGRL